MSRKRLFKIPANTLVNVQDTSKPRDPNSWRKHTTRKELVFEEPVAVSWGDSMYEFLYDDWLIMVAVSRVEKVEK